MNTLNILKTSIVMAAYNGTRFILEQLQSIADQTRAPDEVIVIDDASTDDTREIVAAFIQTNRLAHWRLICNSQNQGWRKTFKQGFEEARGEFIFPCDQDDIWMPDKIERMTDILENDPQILLLSAEFKPLYNQEHGFQPFHPGLLASMRFDGTVERVHLGHNWAQTLCSGCLSGFRRALFQRIRESWIDRYSYDFQLRNYALALDGFYSVHFNALLRRRHGANATFQERSETLLYRIEAEIDALGNLLRFVETEEICGEKARWFRDALLQARHRYASAKSRDRSFAHSRISRRRGIRR
ncbi:MAG: glycosyltransferase [Oscillospiraceae bacterium]|jgi:glycosyltransferase involved in cell wall biosynthesis|nr:glycosyltransferase [Oscillospiraceae bacterium]